MPEALQGKPFVDDIQVGYGFARTMDREREEHVQQVLRQANEELRSLLRQRAELVKRIGTIKQTMAGLANLFGADALGPEVVDLITDPKGRNAHRGFTKMCRMVLMESKRAMSARDVVEQIRERDTAMIARHRDPVASVTTVLNRLAEYGEAQPVTLQNGRRAWQWTSEHVPPSGQ